MRRYLAITLVLLASLVLAAPEVEGYIGQDPVQILMSGPSGTVRCGTTVTISATVLGATDGKPIEEQVVQWNLAKSVDPDDRIARAKTTTDPNGTATVELELGPDPGVRRVTATVTIVKAGIQVKCARRLPQTSLARPGAATLPATNELQVPLADPSIVGAATNGVAGNVATRISMPRIGIDAPIVEGDGVDVPLSAVAHYPGTAWPNGGSNVFLYGHARAGLFGQLWRVGMHDRIDVTLASGEVTHYQVTRIVPMALADDLGYLDPTQGEQLTLETCLWYDEDSPRFIVIAQPLTGSP